MIWQAKPAASDPDYTLKSEEPVSDRVSWEARAIERVALVLKDAVHERQAPIV